MFSNSQVIIVLLIILILLQLYQLFSNNDTIIKENFDKSKYEKVNYNTPMMRCDGNTGILNTKCMLKSTVPTIKKICNDKLNLTDGPNYNTAEGEAFESRIKGKVQKKIKDKVYDDNNSLLQLMNENENEEEKTNDVKSVGNLEN
jgi:hypothetical protein